MIFDEAMELARLIDRRPGWFLLKMGARSGDRLEAKLFEVQAVCDLYWGYMHYFGRPGDLDSWPQYAKAFEEGARLRASSHDQR